MRDVRFGWVLLCAFFLALPVYGFEDGFAGPQGGGEAEDMDAPDEYAEDAPENPANGRAAGTEWGQSSPFFSAVRAFSRAAEQLSSRAPVSARIPQAVNVPANTGTQAHWREPLYSRIFSMGFEVAKRLRYDHTDEHGLVTSWAAGADGDMAWFAGCNFRVFFGGKWGIGVEGLVLDVDKTRESVGYGYYGGFSYDYETTTTKMLWDFDLLYRHPLTPRLLVNAGIGLTLNATTWSTKDSNGNELESRSETGDVGFNWKLGAEYFIGSMWSLTLDWKWHTFGTGIGREKSKISSIVAGIAWTI